MAWTMPAAAKRSSCGRMGRAAARAQTPGKVARVAKDKNWKRVSEKVMIVTSLCNFQRQILGEMLIFRCDLFVCL